MKHIVLCGMMGCGKTTMARLLGQYYGLPAVDTDELVERQAAMTISEIFARQGEDAFRDMETAVCRELSGKENLVIATGGGLPLRAENRALLRENGIVLFLRRDPGSIYDSVDMSGRPLGQQGKEAFLRRFSQREPIYREFSHIVIENFSSPEETLREIVSKLEGQL